MAGLLLSSNVHLILNGQPLARGRKCTLVCAALYSIIEKHAQKDGYCFAGNSTLAAELDKKKETVRQYLWLMKESGWIEVKYHMENNVMVRDGIYPMLDIDYNKKTVTLKDGTILNDKRDSSKAAKPNPRGEDAEVSEGSYAGVDTEESTRYTEEENVDEPLLPDTEESITEMRKLTNAEYSEWVRRNDVEGNTDRRGDIVDRGVADRIQLEVIAESDARKAEEEAQKQQNIQAQQLPSGQPAQTSAVATVQQGAPASVADSPLATPRTSTRKGYDPVLKAFYDAAKALGISIKNNKTAQKHVKRLESVRGDDWCIKYFDFLRINYQSWSYQYKPEIGNELDMIHKAKAIENGMRRMREEQNRKYKVY